MFFKPVDFGLQSLATGRVRPETGATDWCQLGMPLTASIRFDMRSPLDGEPPESAEVDGFRIEAPDAASWRNEELHDSKLTWASG